MGQHYLLIHFLTPMARYASAAASWLLAASLTLPSNHGVWAVDVDANNEEHEPVVSDSSVGGSLVETDGTNVWSWPDAIVEATGQEPITEWKEYLLKDPFNKKKTDAGSTAGIYPSQASSNQVNWNSGGVRGKWWPSISCPFGASMNVQQYGKEQCIGVGQGICKDGWQFGIRNHVDNTYLMLWREDDPANPVYRWFPGATSLCIGEQYPNVAYLRVVFGFDIYYLIGPGAGSADDLVRLKIVPDTQKYKPDDVIVKFRDGPGDDNILWQIFANGLSKTSPDALWYPIPWPSASPSSNPSEAPTSSPSTSPTSSPSSSPSASPTSSPSASPSSSPTSSPSSAPSASPTSSPSTSPSASPSESPSSSPSAGPTASPSSSPSSVPSVSSAPSVSFMPSSEPSESPSSTPSSTPSETPSSTPSSSPSLPPSSSPSLSPSSSPSDVPSSTPSLSFMPSSAPSSAPSAIPSSAPSLTPSATPSDEPSALPSSAPSLAPSALPSSTPSLAPSAVPSSGPSSQPSLIPSSQPSNTPTLF